MVTGDTVNLAARLQAAAPPGGVLISHDTWRHVADLFEAEPQEPLTLKGKAEPVRTYLIARARPRPFRKERVASPALQPAWWDARPNCSPCKTRCRT